MALDLLKDRGTPLEQQNFTWRELVQPTYSKLDDDAFTRVRVIVMSALEAQALRFGHACARARRDLALELARVRRVEQAQRTLVSWLSPADLSPLELAIAHEQATVEVTAALAASEVDGYLRAVQHFGLLEDFDHLYRFAALLDRVEGRDPNTIVQSQTDICPGRPVALAHRAPEDDLRRAYDHRTAALGSKLSVLTLSAMKHDASELYMRAGHAYADPAGRQLYAEIAALEEQHLTQYESLPDPAESWLERWLLHEASEVYHYHACVEAEGNHRIRAIWARCLDYELGQLQHVAELFQRIEGRDPAELFGAGVPAPMRYESRREYVRSVLRAEADLTARGAEFVPFGSEAADAPSRRHRERINAAGSPSELVAAGYVWAPGSELARRLAV